MCDKMVVLGILELHKFHQMHGSSWAHMKEDHVQLKKDHYEVKQTKSVDAYVTSELGT